MIVMVLTILKNLGMKKLLLAEFILVAVLFVPCVVHLLKLDQLGVHLHLVHLV